MVVVVMVVMVMVVVVMVVVVMMMVVVVVGIPKGTSRGKISLAVLTDLFRQLDDGPGQPLHLAHVLAALADDPPDLGEVR